MLYGTQGDNALKSSSYRPAAHSEHSSAWPSHHVPGAQHPDGRSIVPLLHRAGSVPRSRQVATQASPWRNGAVQFPGHATSAYAATELQFWSGVRMHSIRAR